MAKSSKAIVSRCFESRKSTTFLFVIGYRHVCLVIFGIGLYFIEQAVKTPVHKPIMKSRAKKLKLKKMRRPGSLRRVSRISREPKELSLLEKIAKITDELQILRSRLANAGDDLVAVGTHRIAALETELEKLWEMRR